MKTLVAILLCVFSSAGHSEESLSPEAGQDWTLVTTDRGFLKKPEYPGVGGMTTDLLAIFKDKLWMVKWDFHWNSYSSTNGLRWSKEGEDLDMSRMLVVPVGYAVIAFKDKLWKIGGADQDGSASGACIYSSADGVAWSEAVHKPAFGDTAGYAKLVVHNGELWYFGSPAAITTQNDDVWNSQDGLTWTKVGAVPTVSGRTRKGYVVASFNGKLWIIGGMTGSMWGVGDCHNDVWSSEDGKTWTQATEKAAFGNRAASGSVVAGGKLWLFGGIEGSNDSDKLKDVWNSSDAVHWARVTDDAPFEGAVSALSYRSKLWVFGKNVWRSE